MAKQTKSKNKFDITFKHYVVTATCACGASYVTKSTKKSLHVDICGKCHPFFTGEKRFVDAEGRVEKFKKKYKNISK